MPPAWPPHRHRPLADDSPDRPAAPPPVRDVEEGRAGSEEDSDTDPPPSLTAVQWLCCVSAVLLIFTVFFAVVVVVTRPQPSFDTQQHKLVDIIRLDASPLQPWEAMEVFNLSDMNLTVPPQEDFNLYASGTWLTTHDIPADQSCVGSFIGLQEDTLAKMYTLMNQSVAAGDSAAPPTVTAKVGAFWRSAMDTAAIEQAGVAPLQPLRAALQQVNDSTAYASLLGRLHATAITAMFNVAAQPQPDFSAYTILWLDQGGLGMPDREYYFDPKHRQVKEQYEQYVHAIFTLLGYRGATAAQATAAVLEVEAGLAAAAQTLEERRVPENLVHLHNRSTLGALTGPLWDWDAYASALGLDLRAGLTNVPNPAFLRRVAELATNTSQLPKLLLYHEFHLLNAFVPALPERFVAAQFEYRRTLTGQTTLSPRWKRMLDVVNRRIGELAGQLYCSVYFPETSKAAATLMVERLRASLLDTLQTLTWMGNATKLRAAEKARLIGVKVGYPDRWIDYSSLTIDPAAPFAANILRAHEFGARRELAQLWRPVDPGLWQMTPQTVNAYYEPTRNEIVFPAAILQPPFYSPEFDSAVNYGGIGSIIGHELTHGFDDEGRKYDGLGNLVDWWEPADARNFAAAAKLLVAQFDNYTVFGEHVNGRLTEGENIADLGGLHISYNALLQALDEDGVDLNATLQGFTQPQRFYLAWARNWRQKCTRASTLQRVATDPHSPAEWRAKGPLSNLPTFYAAFDVKPGQPMWRPPEARPILW